MTKRRLLPGTATGLLAATIVATALQFAAAPAIAAPASAGSALTGPASSHSQQEEVPFYVVKQTAGQTEFLFAIAERYLGDGQRFPEIFELNEGRLQPDGGSLTVPTSLNPGWILQLPEDAQGPGVEFGPLPTVEDAPSEPRPNAPAPQEPSEPVQPAPVQTIPVTPAPTPSEVASGEPAPPVRDVAAPASARDGVPPIVFIAAGVVLAALLVAAIVFALVRLRRRRVGKKAGSSAYVRDSSASWTIDSALKIAVAASVAEELLFPGLYVVTVDDTSIHLHLTAPSTRAPSGWTASPDGRIWSASLAFLQRQPVPDIHDVRFGGLATLGTTDSGRLLLDFTQARGPVSIDGPADAVDDVVDAWVVELTSNPWSAAPHIAQITARNSDRGVALDDFIAGAGTDPSERGIAIVEEITSRAQGEALRSLFSNPDFHWIVLVKSSFAGASWRFTARDGILSSDLLPDVRYNASTVERANA